MPPGIGPPATVRKVRPIVAAGPEIPAGPQASPRKVPGRFLDFAPSGTRRGEKKPPPPRRSCRYRTTRRRTADHAGSGGCRRLQHVPMSTTENCGNCLGRPGHGTRQLQTAGAADQSGTDAVRSFRSGLGNPDCRFPHPADRGSGRTRRPAANVPPAWRTHSVAHPSHSSAA